MSDALPSPSVSDPSAPSTLPLASEAARRASELSPAQQLVLEQLAQGAGVVQAARATGVNRKTIYRWLHEDPDFGAAYNAWKHEQLESGRARALAMTDAAMSTIGHAIEKGNVNAALRLARELGVLRPSKPGEADPDRLARKRRVADARRETRLRDAEESYAYRRSRKIESIEEIDQIVTRWQALRDAFIKRDEDAWRFYYNTRHLTAAQCRQAGITKPAGPPKFPRPSEAELRAVIERRAAAAARDDGYDDDGPEYVKAYMAGGMIQGLLESVGPAVSAPGPQPGAADESATNDAPPVLRADPARVDGNEVDEET